MDKFDFYQNKKLYSLKYFILFMKIGGLFLD